MELTLVAFAPEPWRDDLRGLLRTLGFRVLTRAPAEWLGAQAPLSPRPTVLFLGSEAYPRDRILTTLGGTRAASLGVFQPESVLCDRALLARCSEFVRWPCREAELGLRLERLGIRPGGIGLADSGALLDEFAALNLVGRSPAFLEALATIKKLARFEAPVLIEGETGTGKELAARAIHYLGSRCDAPFVPVNCGAIPDGLVENELFGHARGAFTDAKEAQRGLVELAGGGTLFLDEVVALSPKAQVALLRILQDREFRPLGGNAPRRANARVIAASNTSLSQAVQNAAFRQDLYFRLNVAHVVLPPLRERGDDVELLAEHFLRQYAQQYDQPIKRLSETGRAWLRAQHWPGNVRELEALVHRAFVLTEGPVVDLPDTESPDIAWSADGLACREMLPQDERFARAKARVIADFERRYLSSLMLGCHGNVSAAARRAGKERRALDRLLKKHSIDKGAYR
jgi:DNA-binding NtrC family response regulator